MPTNIVPAERGRDSVDEDTDFDTDSAEDYAADDNEDRIPTAATVSEPVRPLVSSASLLLDPQQQAGIIRGLAATIDVKGTILLAIAKTDIDTLLVTIQTMSAPNENTASVIPLQVIGTPEEIDTKLLEALSHYVPARAIAVATAQEVAAATATAAAKAKADSDAKRATTKAKPAIPASPAKAKKEALTLNVTPAKAQVTIRDEKNETIDLENGRTAQVEPGRYTITVEAEGYETATETINFLRSHTRDITLKEKTPSLF